MNYINEMRDKVLESNIRSVASLTSIIDSCYEGVETATHEQAFYAFWIVTKGKELSTTARGHSCKHQLVNIYDHTPMVARLSSDVHDVCETFNGDNSDITGSFRTSEINQSQETFIDQLTTPHEIFSETFNDDESVVGFIYTRDLAIPEEAGSSIASAIIGVNATQNLFLSLEESIKHTFIEWLYDYGG